MPLEAVDSRGCYGSPIECQPPKSGQFREVFHAGVRDVRISQAEEFKLGEPSKVFQALVADIGIGA